MPRRAQPAPSDQAKVGSRRCVGSPARARRSRATGPLYLHPCRYGPSGLGVVASDGSSEQGRRSGGGPDCGGRLARAPYRRSDRNRVAVCPKPFKAGRGFATGPAKAHRAQICLRLMAHPLGFSSGGAKTRKPVAVPVIRTSGPFRHAAA